MKKSNIYYLILVCLCSTAISCSKKGIKSGNDDLLTGQVEKIETFLAKGAAKAPLINDPNIPKVETSASPQLIAKLDAQWQKEIEATYKKSRVMGVMGAADNPRAFAVFKGGSCGGYPELEIKMDCENNRSATYAEGNVGASGVDDYKDAYLHFCVINDYFWNYMDVTEGGPTPSTSRLAHGFLYLGETWYFDTDPHTFPYPQGISKYFYPGLSAIRVFDNEDNSNDNAVWFGMNQEPLTYWLTPTAHSQAAYVSGNTRLHFIVSPDLATGNTMPRLGVPGLTDYYLLGKFGSYQGTIFLDDEDTNNRNVFEAGGYYAHTNDATGNRVTQPFPGSSTVEGGSNTWLHLSRVY